MNTIRNTGTHRSICRYSKRKDTNPLNKTVVVVFRKQEAILKGTECIRDSQDTSRGFLHGAFLDMDRAEDFIRRQGIIRCRLTHIRWGQKRWGIKIDRNMRKAVNLIVNKRGDDGKENRLLSYLSKKLPCRIESVMSIGEHVYKVKERDGFFILKGYPSLRRLKIQERFILSLKKSGFHQTYGLYPFFGEHPLQFHSLYFTFLEYIEPGSNPFYYNDEQQCREGLELLNHFHDTSAKLMDNFQHVLPSFSLKDKWSARFSQFKKNYPIIRFFLPYSVIQELFSWGHWSLTGLRREWGEFNQSPHAILHGDVAYHNFLRTKDNELYLIDFDLISVGPIVNDYIQYANRILPFFNWNAEVLSNYRQFKSYLRECYFLYALAYPADIYREWNRVIKERKYQNARQVGLVIEVTLKQFEQRRKFIEQLVRLNK